MACFSAQVLSFILFIAFVSGQNAGPVTTTKRAFSGIDEVMTLKCDKPDEIMCLRFYRVGVCCLKSSPENLKNNPDGDCVYLGPKTSTLVNLVRNCSGGANDSVITTPFKSPCTFRIGSAELTPVPNERIINTKTCQQAPSQNASSAIEDNRFYVQYDCISGATTCDKPASQEGILYLALSVAIGLGLTIVVGLLGACTRNMFKPKKE